MKRMLFALLTLLTMLSACSEPKAVQPTATPLASAIPKTPAIALTPTIEPIPELELDLKPFFGSDPDRAISLLQPVLEAMAKAACSHRESFTGRPSDDLAWSAVYSLLNNYWSEFGSDVKQMDGGSFELNGKTMKSVFEACFAYSYEKLPAVSANYKNEISYDAAVDVYRIERSEGETEAYRVDNVTLSVDGKSAVVDMNVFIGEGSDEAPYQETGKAAIEIVADEDAKYHFAVHSVQVAPQ